MFDNLIKPITIQVAKRYFQRPRGTRAAATAAKTNVKGRGAQSYTKITRICSRLEKAKCYLRNNE